MKYIKIHKEGYWILLGLCFVLFVVNLIVYMHYPKIIFAISTILSSLILIFFTYFFRNPTRVVEIDDPGLVVAPADGTVVVVEPTEEPEYFGDRRIQVSIFMSIFNVHANWYPVAGRILKSVHHNGNHNDHGHKNGGDQTDDFLPAPFQFFHNTSPFSRTKTGPFPASCGYLSASAFQSRIRPPS